VTELKTNKMMGLWAVCASAAMMLGVPAWAGEWHVSPSGKIGNDGSARAPFNTVKAAIEAAGKAGEASEIILHAGVYPGDIMVPAASSGANAPALVIRAASKPGGGYEEAVIDGGQKVKGARVVDNAKGIYFHPITLGNFEPSMWEEGTRTRYIFSADRRAVEANRATLAPGRFGEGSEARDGVFFRTSDGKTPESHDLEIARDRFGIVVQRANVTIKGLKFRNFQLYFGVRAVSIEAPNVTVDSCEASNCYGMVGVGEKVPGAKVINCVGRDMAGGVKSYGLGTVVENCRFYRVDDGFVVQENEQDQSGIQFYSSNTQTARGNLCVGFQTGVFIKASGGVAVLENNTVIAGSTRGERGIGPNTWRPGSICRGNVVVGFEEPIGLGDGLSKEVNVSGNLIDPGTTPGRTQETVNKIKELCGGENTVAVVKFVDPAKGDYRLATAIGTGAMGVAVAGEPDKAGPTLEATVLAPAQALGLKASLFEKKNTWIGGVKPELVKESMVDPDGLVWLVPGRSIQLKLTGVDALGKVAQMRYRLGAGAWTAPAAFAEKLTVELPGGEREVTLEVQVSDTAGNWSNSVKVRATTATQAPKLVGKPTVTASDRGVIVAFKTDVPCNATLEWGTAGKLENRTGDAIKTEFRFNNVLGLEWNTQISGPRTDHCIAITSGIKAGDELAYRLKLGYEAGESVEVGAGKVSVKGAARTLHVSTGGSDQETGGGKDMPFASIQFAVDRALPGDRVLVAPGVYHGNVVLTHGGTQGAPIRIESTEPWGAVLDGQRERDYGFALCEVSHVQIVGFEARWVNVAGVMMYKASDILIQGCRFWDRHWVKGRPSSADAMVAYHSKGITLDGNVVFALNSGFRISESEGIRITNNTAVKCFHRVAQINYSSKGYLRNNSFGFGASYLLDMVMTDAQFESFDSDYNNFAVYVRGDAPGFAEIPKEQMLKRPDNDFGYGESKSLATRTGPHSAGYKHGQSLLMATLAAWQKESGQDKHSVFTHPMYVDPQNRDFRLKAQSPNAGKGENGANIGAMGVEKK
jgi:hypothetical protein